MVGAWSGHSAPKIRLYWYFEFIDIRIWMSKKTLFRMNDGWKSYIKLNVNDSTWYSV